MDAFSVSITKGFVMKSGIKHAFIIALFFGVFQAVMPIGDGFRGYSLKHMFQLWTPWIAFILLSIIGIKMIYEGTVKTYSFDVYETFSFVTVKFVEFYMLQKSKIFASF